MTTKPITPALRAALKRLLKNRFALLVNANGDITNFETYISLTPGTPLGTWHDISYTPGIKTLFTADEITTHDDGITIRVGEDTIALNSEAYEHSIPVPTPASEEPQLIIRSADGHNHAALSIVASTAATDMTLPTLTAAHIRGNYAGTTGTDPEAVTALSTDRYLATHATLTAQTADVDALLPMTLLQEVARRKAWTLTLSNDVTTIDFEDLGITVASNNLDADYPPAERLYPSQREAVSSFSARPKHLAAALRGLDIPAPEPAILTSDGTVYADGTPEMPVSQAVGTPHEDASEIIGLDPRFLLKQARAVGANWKALTISWGSAIKPATVDWGYGIEGLIMPFRVSLPRPGEGQVAREAA